MTEAVDISTYQDDAIMKNALKTAKNIAVVGLSDNPERSSNSVSQYMQRHYNIIPVNPKLDEVLGVKCYPSLEAIPGDIEIDIFQVVFARTTNTDSVVERLEVVGDHETCQYLSSRLWGRGGVHPCSFGGPPIVDKGLL